MEQSIKTKQSMQNDSEFVHFWNEILAPKFIKYRHILVGGLSYHSDAVFPTLPIRKGMRVLDVGCGFGDTAVKLAERAGPGGEVMGMDCCDAFLELAQEYADAAGADNVSFQRGDAEIGLPSAAFDIVFARFGTMFFANPVPALRHMRQALKPGGRMVHIVWRERPDNPWLSMAKDIVLQFLPQPDENGLSCGPGPFSMADEAHTRSLMLAAGFENIEFRRVDAPVLVGNDVREAIDFQLAIGPAGEVFREAGALGEERREEIEAALANALNEQSRSANSIVMDSSSWVISAINPGA